MSELVVWRRLPLVESDCLVELPEELDCLVELPELRVLLVVLLVEEELPELVQAAIEKANAPAIVKIIPFLSNAFLNESFFLVLFSVFNVFINLHPFLICYADLCSA